MYGRMSPDQRETLQAAAENMTRWLYNRGTIVAK